MVTGRSCYKPSSATGKPRHRAWSPALGSVFTHNSRAFRLHPQLPATPSTLYTHGSGPLRLHPQLWATPSTPTAPGHCVYTLHPRLRATPSTPAAPGHSVCTHFGPLRLRLQLWTSVYIHNSKATPSTLKTPGNFVYTHNSRTILFTLTTPGHHSIYTQNSGPPRLRPQLRGLAASPQTWFTASLFS